MTYPSRRDLRYNNDMPHDTDFDEYDEHDLTNTIEVTIIESGAEFHQLDEIKRDFIIVRHYSGGATLIVSPDGILTSVEVFDTVEDAIESLAKLREVEFAGECD